MAHQDIAEAVDNPAGMKPGEEEMKAIRELQRQYHQEVRKFMDDNREEIGP